MQTLTPRGIDAAHDAVSVFRPGAELDRGLTSDRGARAAQARPPGPHRLREQLAMLAEFQSNPFRCMERLREVHGDLVHFSFLGLEFFFVYAPHTVDHVMARNASNYRKNSVLRGWNEAFGQGLLTADAPVWKRSRRLMQPAFHRDQLAEYRLRMETCARAFAEGLESGRAPVQRLLMGLALDIVARTLFGRDIPADTVARASAALARLTEYFEATQSAPGQLLRKWPFPARFRYLRAIRELEEIVLGFVAARYPGTWHGERSTDLLGMLLAASDDDGSSFTGQQLRDELFTLFLAGHETTGLALNATLFLLAHHPDVQEQTASELAEGNTEPLRRVIRESLRLYPPAWGVGREPIEDDVIDGYRIPAGANVVIPIWVIHRDPRTFPDPRRFDPERWTPQLEQRLSHASYLPFGYGPRMCIGAQFATIEMEVVLTELLTRWHVRPSSDTPALDALELRGSITARPRHELFLDLARR